MSAQPSTISFDALALDRVREASEHLAAQNAVEEAPSSSRTFREASEDVLELVRSVMKEHFDVLVKAGVTVKTIMAHAGVDEDGEPKGPALKVHGVQAAGKIKVVSLADRVAGLKDAVMTLDGDRWSDWDEMEQRSLIAHELTHLEPTGKVDDAGRPKLKVRQHDVDLGVFLSVMEVFGSDSLDTKIMAKAAEDTRVYIQPMLSFG